MYVQEPILLEDIAVEFDAKVREVHVNGCCAKKCSDKYSLDELLSFNYSSRELDYNVDGSNILDLCILGQIKGMCRTSNEVKAGRVIVAKKENACGCVTPLGALAFVRNCFL